MSQPDATSFPFVNSPASSPPTSVAVGRLPRLAYGALLALAGAGVLARLFVIAISNGSDDMLTWASFAQHINTHGLWQTYRDIPDFNHPPLMGLLAGALMKLSVGLDVPFRLLWKLPPLLADLCVLRLLWGCFKPEGKLWAAGAMALFSINPISITVTAFHGNTDSVCALLCLCAALLHRRERPLLAGLALAGAINVKVFPLVLVPGFLLLCRSPRAGLRFLVGMALGCVPLAVACLVVPQEFYANALHYNSQLNRWGVNAWVFDAERSYPRFYRLITHDYRDIGRFFILMVAGLVALLGRAARWDAVRVAALSLAAFLFLAPGFGVQYLVWPVPLLAVASLQYSAWWALFGGAFAVLIYESFLVKNEWPLRSEHYLITSTVGLVGLCAWAVLGCYLYSQIVKLLGEPELVQLRRRAGHWLGAALRRTS
jgi:hypothetical protein